MEFPSGWDSLTAALAVAPLGRPFEAWAFLALQGLVRDEPGDRELFAAMVASETALGDITGPSLAMRVRLRLGQAGMVRPGAERPDPGAEQAGERWDQVLGWRSVT